MCINKPSQWRVMPLSTQDIRLVLGAQRPVKLMLSRLTAVTAYMETLAQIIDIQTIVLLAFSTITVHDCNQWIKDSMIYH